MINKASFYRWVVIIFLFAMVLSACSGGSAGNSSASVPNKGDVVVYVAVPMSGFQANAGQTVFGGVRLAAEEFNRTGGINGYKIIVRPLDDESTDDVAVANVQTVQEAIGKGEKVLGVIGHLNSGQTAAAMELYKNLNLVVITPTASESAISQKGYKNFFRVNADDSIQAETVSAFIKNQLKASTVAVVYNDSSYGVALAKSVKQDLEKIGAKVVLDLKVKEGQSDFSKETPQIKQANPTVIFYAGYEIDTPYLREALVTAGVSAPMLASDGAFLSTTIDESNDTAEGMYLSSFAPSPKAMASSKWIESYQAVEARNPDTYSVNGYIAMQVMAQAARKAGSLESEKVAEAIRSNTFPTLIGDLSYQPNGDLKNAKVWIYQVLKGEFSQVDWNK